MMRIVLKSIVKFFLTIVDLFLGLLLLAGVAAIPCGFVGLIWHTTYQNLYGEISTYEYTQVRKWTKDYPELWTYANDRMWEDDMIDHTEFADIERMKYKLEKEAVKSTIRTKE